MHDLDPDKEMRTEQADRAALLSEAEIAKVDEALYESASNTFQKQSKVVGLALMALDDARLSDVFASTRVQNLVSKGRLEHTGDLNRMRYSEIRRSQ